jgi:hypothetical protein
MTRQLVFVHGRAQQNRDAAALKTNWIAALKQGLAKSNLSLPIGEEDIRFPFYGDTLDGLVRELPEDKIAGVIIRGAESDEAHQAFMRSVLEEVRQKEGITEEQVEALMDRDVIQRGPENWEWVQGLLKAIDTYVPHASGASIALVTNDVYQYLRNPGIRDTIETGVRAAITPAVPTVVVGHSLGTVVAYNMLQREGAALGWVVPLYVSLGSPLAVTAIKQALRPIKHPPCVEKWYNAMDERDVVSLYPLDKLHFDIDPEVENKTNVDNQTGNRHGISGYLSDKDVAQRIHEALVAT